MTINDMGGGVELEYGQCLKEKQLKICRILLDQVLRKCALSVITAETDFQEETLKMTKSS